MALRRSLALFMLVLLVATIGYVEVSAKPAARLLIPLYSCPSDESGSLWRAVEAAASQVNITIIWGIICEEDDYRSALERLAAVGVSRLAYVATSDSARPLEELKARVDFYSGFSIDGIFFDEVSSDPSKWNYDEQIIEYARSFPQVKRVVLNSPYADADFVRAMPADTVVVFENPFSDWEGFCTGEYAGISPSRMAALIHHTPASLLKRALDLASSRGIGYVYVTDRPWDQLPSYFQEELGLVRLLSSGE